MTAQRCCVVVPARDEEDLIGACVDALGAQRGVGPGDFEVIVVLDGCTDRTGAELEAARGRNSHLHLTVIDGPGRGAGLARRMGMDAALGRLGPTGLIACTDADSTVAPDWVAAQLHAAGRGARAIGGRIELSDSDRRRLGPYVMADRAERQRRRHLRIRTDPGPPGSTSEHWQFSGASLAVTAEAYTAVGGMPHAEALEDEAFERALIAQGVPIHRLLTVNVTTSGRLSGRATEGLAHDLTAAVEKTAQRLRR